MNPTIESHRSEEYRAKKAMPFSTREGFRSKKLRWVRPDLNQRPRHLQCRALPTKLLTRAVRSRTPAISRLSPMDVEEIKHSRLIQFHQELPFELQTKHRFHHLHLQVGQSILHLKTLILLQCLEFRRIFHQRFLRHSCRHQH